MGVVAVAAAMLLMPSARAGVTSSSQINAYWVGGSTASDLVSFMRNRPFHGDRGDAVANIRPSYALSVTGKQAGSACRASDVNLKVRFVITIPRARNAGGMSPATRAAWNGFVAFATRHENQHKSIYLQCANDFVARAMRMTAASCFALSANVRSQFEAAKRACDKRQLAFDRQDYGRVTGLSLFAMAGSPGRKVVKARPTSPVARVIPVSAPGTGLIGPR